MADDVKEVEIPKMRTRLEVLVSIYNEQLDQVTRSQVDARLFDVLCIAEPNDKGLLEQKVRNESMLKRKEKLIKILEDLVKEEIARVGGKN